MTRSWFITGISSGFGREMTEQLLRRGDRVFGTVRRAGSVDDLLSEHGKAIRVAIVDVTDGALLREVVDAAFEGFGRIDVVVANAGYGLFGAVEEVSDQQIEHELDTNLLGTIRTVRAALPHLRQQGGGRIILMSSVAGLTAHAGAAIYHSSKWGVEGFGEALAQEVAAFDIGVTLVEPGGARTGFASTGLQLAEPLPAYSGTPAGFVQLLRDGGGPVPIQGHPSKIAARVIASADTTPTPLRLVLGSDAYAGITTSLRARLAIIEPQEHSAATTATED